MDLFEPLSSNEQHPRDSLTLKRVVLQSCVTCHATRGILSVNSYTRSLQATPQISFSPTRPARLIPFEVERAAMESINWKHRQSDWALLQELWYSHEN